ncbi:hypothetical protein CASFOL_023297 [Castilleja foliolosa]|uniref:Uncharacterized protein n=1 Tax=Castilleja foliolosa TaxID=1961234 RepID=A0ABD3CK67_9LAMI
MNWVQRKIYLYNVTFGLYMLDWWERFLFSLFYFLYTGGCVDAVIVNCHQVQAP